ncbi:MAG: hypothetical protein VX752_05125, partial [Actinomycetota bacterium]|nr:hypothetical protein [Actinomycetota bacterium]
MIRTVLAGLRPTTVPGFRWSSKATAGALAAVGAAGMFSVLATASGLVDLLGSGDDTVLLVTLGGLVGLVSSIGYSRIRPAERIRDADVLGGITLCLLLLVLMVGTLHLLIGTT